MKSPVLFFLVFSLLIGQASAGSYSLNGLSDHTTNMSLGMKKVMVIGDSISAIPCYACASGKEYPTVLNSELNAYDNNWVIVSEAIAGERSDEGKARLISKLDVHSPEIVIIMYGINDLGQGKAEANIVDNISWMANESKNRSIKPYILLVLNVSNTTIQPGVQSLNNAIKTRANGTNVTYIDTFDAMDLTPNDGIWQGYNDSNFADGVHPNGLPGMQLIADKIYNQIISDYTRTWNNSQFINVSNDVCTSNVQLNNSITDYIGMWRGNGCSRDQNTTGHVDGIPTSGIQYSNDGFVFDGSSNINLSYPLSLKNTNDATFVFLNVVMDSITGYRTLYSESEYNVGGRDIWINEGAITYRTHNGGNALTTSSTTVSVGQRFDLIVSVNGTTTRIYINETEVSYATQNTLSYTPSTKPIKIGSFWDDSGYFDGNFSFIFFNHNITFSEISTIVNSPKELSGYIKLWHNSTPNETYQIDVNGTNQTNSNVSLQYAQNNSSPSGFVSPENTSLNASWSLSPRFTNTDIYLWLFGNGTSTPQVSNITFFDQAVSEGATPIVNPFVAVGVAAMGIAVSIAIYNMYRRRGRPPMMFIPGFL